MAKKGNTPQAQALLRQLAQEQLDAEENARIYAMEHDAAEMQAMRRTTDQNALSQDYPTHPCLWQGTFDEFCAGASCSFGDYSLSTSNHSVCTGSSAILSTTGGSTFIWSTGETTSSITVSPLMDAWYYLTLATTGGCNRYDAVFITVNEPPIANASGTDVTVPGGNDGGATSSATGGQSPYSFLWNNGEMTAMISELIAGSYSCTISDVNGCEDVIQITINEPACQPAGTPCNDGDPSTYNDIEDGNCNCTGTPCPLISDGLSSSDISCKGANDGIASVSPSGGQPTYTINWSNGSSANSVNALAAGGYFVTITDLNGCSIAVPFSISEPMELTSTISGMDESVPGANDGSVDLSVSGGTLPYTFLWNNGATTEDLTNLTGQNTTYSVTITDDHGCVITKQVTLQTGCFVAGTLCDDGDPDTYNDVEDGNCNCTGTPCPVISVGLSTSSISCFGANDGTSSVSPSGGQPAYAVSWSNGATGNYITGLIAGDYSVTIYDLNGCSITVPFIVSEPAEFSATIIGMDESMPGANDGSVDLSVSGGTLPYTFLWNTGATAEDLTNLTGQNTTYSVTITDGHGCMITKQVTIQTGCFPAGTPCDDGDQDTYNDIEDGSCNCTGTECTLGINLSKADISCFGAADGHAWIQIFNATSPYRITWSNGDTTLSVSNLEAGVHYVSVVDSTGCVIQQSFRIDEPNPLELGLNGHDESSPGVADGSIDLTISGGSFPYYYQWSTGAITEDIDMLLGENMNYSVTVFDSRGCEMTGSTTLNTGCKPEGTPCDDQNASTYDDLEDGSCECTGIPCENLVLNAIQKNITCFGANDGMIAVTPSGGEAPFSFEWSTNTFDNSISNLHSGIYGLTITDANGCVTQDLFQILEPEELALSAEISPATTNLSADGSIRLTITGGTESYEVQWDDGSDGLFRDELIVGIYGMTVRDANGCTISDSFTISAMCSLNGLPCDDGDENTTNDMYDEECECTGTPCVQITEVLSLAPILCSGDSSTIAIDTQGLELTALTWSNGDSNTTSARFTPGSHSVHLVQANGCSTELDFNITEPEPLDLTLHGIDESGQNANNGSAEVQISGGVSPYIISWSTSETTSQIQKLAGDVTYTVTVTDNNGCQSVDSIYIAEFICAGLFEGEILAIAKPADLCNFIGSITIQSDIPFAEGTEFSLDGIDFQENPEFTDLSAGTYYPQLRDNSSNCQLNLDPLELRDLSILDPIVNDPNDCNSSDGSISNQNPDIEIALSSSGPWHKDSITNLSSGIYHIFGRDPLNHCIVDLGSQSLGLTIESNALQISSSDAFCGQDLGMIEIESSDDTYEYSIDRGNRWYSNHQFFEVSTGTYEVLIRLVDGCVIPFDQIDISKVEGLEVSEIEVTPPSGCETKDGQILVLSDGLYHYSQDFGQTWSTDHSFINLSAGSYEIWISDSSGFCFDTLNVDLEAQASDIDIAVETVLEPSCAGSADGFIGLSAFNDSTNISWVWNNGKTGPEQGRLEAGTYRIEALVSPFCSKTFEIELTDPEPIIIPPVTIDSVLYCQGESVEIEIPDTSLTYQWYREDRLFDEGPKITIASEGNYRVQGINASNCASEREFSIDYSEVLFVPNFLLASVAEAGQPTLAIEISWPVPEEIIWEVEGGDIIETYLNQSTLVFTDTGEYDVTLKAMRNGCMSTVKKTIVVQEQGLLTYPSHALDESIILSLYPNPNLGNFNALIELSEPSELQIRVYNEEGMIVYGQHFDEVKTLSHNVDIAGSKPGIYTLLVQTDTNWKAVSFVIE